MKHAVDITSLAHGGDGIGRIDGQVCFVPFGLPGDTLEVNVVRRKKSAMWAELKSVITPSPDRIVPSCPQFGRCGMCNWAHFAYPAQAVWKQRIARDLLQRLGGIETELLWAENETLRTGYRTRAEFHGDGKQFGLYAPGTHDIVDTVQCPLCHPRLNEALAGLRDAGIKGSVTVTVNPEGGETLVWTGFSKRKLKDRFPLANSARDETPRSSFMFDGIPVVNGAFSQASLLLNRILIDKTRAALGTPVSVLDLYCGSGNLSLGLPENVRVLGVDHNRHAIRAANQVRKGSYRPGDESIMEECVSSGDWDTILLDPPRAGAKAITQNLALSSARALVYVSCDAATLARDLKALATAGWRVVRADALDLFPNTPHVEIVCRLER